MDVITGYIKKYVFVNKANSYRIAIVLPDLNIEGDKVVVVGHFPHVDKYDLCKFEGKYVKHRRYGHQFQVTNFKKVLPSDKEALIKYLSQRKFGPINEKEAEQLYDLFADQALRMIVENPDLLQQTTIPVNKQLKLITCLKKEENYQIIIDILIHSGLRYRELDKAIARFGDDMSDLISNNPYLLLDNVDIDFRCIDKVASKLNITLTDSKRIEALIKYTLEKECNNSGDTYLSLENFKNKIAPLGFIDTPQYQEKLQELINSGEIIVTDDKITLFNLYNAEKIIADTLIRLNGVCQPQLAVDLEALLTKLQLSCSSDQLFALQQALNNPVSIITGGPGTGKTTIIKVLYQIFHMCSKTVVLLAPTGRAANRLKEVCQTDASTIHRFLGWDLHTNQFNKSYTHQCLIIDEVSMVDSLLLGSLLQLGTNIERIVFVGDKDQLPSVSPGNILRDLIKCDHFAVSTLKTIFRQQQGSAIIALADAIKNGEVNNGIIKNDVTYQALDENDWQLSLLNLVQNKDLNQFQVIAPFYQGIWGINNLNLCLQEIYNPPDQEKAEIIIDGIVFRQYDRILQLKNQPDDDVYNGDLGYIKEIGLKEKKVFIQFEDNVVEYRPATFHFFRHGYAISVHKAQGSEFSEVLFVIGKEYRNLLEKNLIYTACTRAKEKLFLSGDLKAFITGSHKVNADRLTMLVDQIQKKEDI